MAYPISINFNRLKQLSEFLTYWHFRVIFKQFCNKLYLKRTTLEKTLNVMAGVTRLGCFWKVLLTNFLAKWPKTAFFWLFWKNHNLSKDCSDDCFGNFLFHHLVTLVMARLCWLCTMIIPFATQTLSREFENVSLPLGPRRKNIENVTGQKIVISERFESCKTDGQIIWWPLGRFEFIPFLHLGGHASLTRDRTGFEPLTAIT